MERRNKNGARSKAVICHVARSTAPRRKQSHGFKRNKLEKLSKNSSKSTQQSRSKINTHQLRNIHTAGSKIPQQISEYTHQYRVYKATNTPHRSKHGTTEKYTKMLRILSFKNPQINMKTPMILQEDNTRKSHTNYSLKVRKWYSRYILYKSLDYNAYKA